MQACLEFQNNLNLEINFQKGFIVWEGNTVPLQPKECLQNREMREMAYHMVIALPVLQKPMHGRNTFWIHTIVQWIFMHMQLAKLM